MEAIVKKIKETLNDDEFVDQCSKYLNETSMVSYTEVKDLIGYKKKESIEQILSKYDFVVDVDYKIVKEKITGKCKPINEIYMTIDTIKCICLMAPTEKSQQFRKYYIQMEKIFKEIATTEYLNKLTNPVHELNNYDLDISKYKGKETIYVIKIKDNNYKFGHTGNIIRRLETHKRELNYECVIKLWSCDDRSVSKKIEDNIKLYIKHQKIGVTYKTQVEIFKTDNIDKILDIINGYHTTFSEENKKLYQDSRLTQKKEILMEKKDILVELNKLFENVGNDDKLKKIICKSLETKILLCTDQNNNSINNNAVIDDDDDNNDDNDDINDGDNDDINDGDDDDCESICSEILEQNLELSDTYEINNNILRKCQRCNTPHTEEEFGINARTKKSYMNCDECREKQVVSDAKRKDVRKESVQKYNKQYLEKHGEEINKKRRENYVYKEKLDPEIRTEQRKIKQKEYYKEHASEIIEYKKQKYLEKKQLQKDNNETTEQVEDVEIIVEDDFKATEKKKGFTKKKLQKE
jgi:phage anti-repressor protein